MRHNYTVTLFFCFLCLGLFLRGTASATTAADIGREIGRGTRDAVEATKEAGKKVAETAKDSSETAWDRFKKSSDSAWESFKKSSDSAWEDFKKFFKGLGEGWKSSGGVPARPTPGENFPGGVAGFTPA